MSDLNSLTAAVKSLALEAGFVRVGVAPAGLVPFSQGLQTWLGRQWHGRMGYMAENLATRLRPDLLVDGAQSVICLAVGYSPAAVAACDDEPRQGSENVPGPVTDMIARFARGRDYHKVLKKRCHALMDRLRELEPGFAGRAFVDSAPVMERSLAAMAGLGWIGRNGCLFVPGLGSYVLLCEIVCNLRLTPDKPVENQCDNCRACVGACPTGALADDGLVDARRCISYLTIEHRQEIDPAYWPQMAGRLFGCDACQEACPHNRELPAGDAELTGQGPPLGGATLADILQWKQEDWDLATRASACRRATCEMWVRNARIAEEDRS